MDKINDYQELIKILDYGIESINERLETNLDAYERYKLQKELAEIQAEKKGKLEYIKRYMQALEESDKAEKELKEALNNRLSIIQELKKTKMQTDHERLFNAIVLNWGKFDERKQLEAIKTLIALKASYVKPIYINPACSDEKL